MGLWSALGTIGGLAAAPFTGGASIPLAMTIGGAAGGAVDALTNGAGNVGQVAGNAASAAAQNRLTQGGLINNANRNLIDLYAQEAKNAGENNANALTAPTKIARQGVLASMIENGHNANFSGLPSYIKPPTLSGGLLPDSILTPDVRKMGGNLTREAMLAQLTGEKNNFQIPNMPTAPTMAPLPESGKLESGLSTTGLIGGLIGAASPIIKSILSGHGVGGNSGGDDNSWMTDGIG